MSQTSQTNVKQVDVGDETIGTQSSKDNKKREATSPLDAQDLLQKKNRHESSGSTPSRHMRSK